MTGSDVAMKKGGERFHVQVSEQAHLPPYDATVDIGMEGIRVFHAAEGTKCLMEIPLDMISRWSMRSNRLLLFTKSNVDRDERVVTVIGSQFTIRSVLDTLTSCCMQMAEILEHEHEQDTRHQATEQYSVPSADQVPFWSHPEKCGWMQSQGDHIKTWRKRWFILKDGYLFRFSSPEVDSKSTPRGILDLSGVADVSDGCEATGKECAIRVTTQQGPVYFVAENETSQVEWISALEESVARIVRRVAGIRDDTRQSLSHQLEKRYNQASAHTHAVEQPRAPVSHNGHVGDQTRNTYHPIRHNDATIVSRRERAYGGDGYGMIQIVNYGEQREEERRGPEMIQIDTSSIVGATALPYSSENRNAIHHMTGAAGQNQPARPAGDLMDFAPPIQSPPPPPQVWETHYTEDGTPYYYNTLTGESTWERQ